MRKIQFLFLYENTHEKLYKISLFAKQNIFWSENLFFIFLIFLRFQRNLTILIKFNLALWFFISLNYTLDWFQTFNFMQFHPWKTSISTLDFSLFFTLVLGFRFIQVDSQVTIKLYIFFNFIPDFNQLGSYSSVSFTNWSLVVNLFNLTINLPQNFDFLAILPTISINWLGKN